MIARCCANIWGGDERSPRQLATETRKKKGDRWKNHRVEMKIQRTAFEVHRSHKLNSERRKFCGVLMLDCWKWRWDGEVGVEWRKFGLGSVDSNENCLKLAWQKMRQRTGRRLVVKWIENQDSAQLSRTFELRAKWGVLCQRDYENAAIKVSTVQLTQLRDRTNSHYGVSTFSSLR
jgi:hypothetical protein